LSFEEWAERKERGTNCFPSLFDGTDTTCICSLSYSRLTAVLIHPQKEIRAGLVAEFLAGNV